MPDQPHGIPPARARGPWSWNRQQDPEWPDHDRVGLHLSQWISQWAEWVDMVVSRELLRAYQETPRKTAFDASLLHLTEWGDELQNLGMTLLDRLNGVYPVPQRLGTEDEEGGGVETDHTRPPPPPFNKGRDSDSTAQV